MGEVTPPVEGGVAGPPVDGGVVGPGFCPPSPGVGSVVVGGGPAVGVLIGGTNRTAVITAGDRFGPKDSAIIRAPATAAPPRAIMPMRRETNTSVSLIARPAAGTAPAPGGGVGARERQRAGGDGRGSCRARASPAPRAGARVQSLPSPLQLGDARADGGGAARCQLLPEGGRVLANLVDPFGTLDRAEPRETGDEADGGGQRHPHLARVDARGPCDGHHGGRPDDHELRPRTELGRELCRGDADRVIEHDHIGLCITQHPSQVADGRGLAHHQEPVVGEHVAQGLPGTIPLSDDHANASLIHPHPSSGLVRGRERDQRTRTPRTELPTFGGMPNGGRDLGR